MSRVSSSEGSEDSGWGCAEHSSSPNVTTLHNGGHPNQCLLRNSQGWVIDSKRVLLQSLLPLWVLDSFDSPADNKQLDFVNGAYMEEW